MWIFYKLSQLNQEMKKKYVWWTLVAVVIAGGAIFWFGRSKQKAEAELMVEVARGEFEILVAVTGELQAKNFENITGPDMRSGVFRIPEFRIQDLVPEGTLVDSGDYVAELDRSNASNALLDLEEQIEQDRTGVETTALDSAVNLKGLRDNLLNLRLAVEEAKITLAESRFEPPATIRKAEINVDKAVRAVEQAVRQYELREQVSKVNMMNAQMRLDRRMRQKQEMDEILAKFVIRAPKKGMVIYRRERNGQKRKTGATINPWDNVVAQLPDLSVMLSRTYVNEIDISKVKVGQKVRIGVDAFPEKKYTGVITSVADIGEQLASTDAKVFEVVIEVNESDPIMRPSMTTGNSILINTLSNVTFLSIDAVYSQDSIPFVYTSRNTRQVIVLGESNENEVIVEQGLSEGDKVYLSVPENANLWKMSGEELIPTIKQRALEKKKEKEELDRKANDERKSRPRQRPRGTVPGNGAGNGTGAGTGTDTNGNRR
jgi:hypothetical protein